MTEELKECTFTPRINKSTLPSAYSSPRGFDDTVQRMRYAVQARKTKKEAKDSIGKPKLLNEFFTQDGLTEVKPFQFYTHNRPERLKHQRSSKQAESPRLLPSVSPQRTTSHQQPFKQLQSAYFTNSKQSAVKLFDVDVRVSKDQVVRIEMTDQDDAWTISSYFQQQYGLTKQANAALFELLQSNYENELVKRQQTTRANSSQQTQIEHEVSSDSKEYTSHFQREPSEDYSAGSDDDNCDVAEDSWQTESNRARF